MKWCDIIIISLYKLAEVLASYPGSQLGEGEGEPSISCGGGLATRLARERERGGGGGEIGKCMNKYYFQTYQ